MRPASSRPRRQRSRVCRAALGHPRHAHRTSLLLAATLAAPLFVATNALAQAESPPPVAPDIATSPEPTPPEPTPDAAPAAGPSPAESRVVAGVDFANLRKETTERIDALNLEQRVILRLLQEGFAVSAPYAQPDVLLKLEDLPSGVRLVAEALGQREAVEVPLTSGSRAELQLEIAQRIVDLARSRATAVLADRATKAGVANPAPAPLRPQPRPWTPDPIPPRVHLRASLGVDALWRGPAVDPLARLTVGVEPPGSFAVDVSLGFAPSGADGLTVRDYHLQAGPRVRLLDAGPFRADVGLLAGVMYHWFDPAVAGEDSPLDFFVTVPVVARYELTEAISAGLRLAPGLAHRGRLHEAEARETYRREAARLEAGLFASALF